MDNLNNPPNSPPVEKKNLIEIALRHKKKALVVLAVVLLGEMAWAASLFKDASFINSSATVTLTPVVKEKIGSLSLVPSQTEIKPGEEFTVQVNVDTNNRQINGADSVVTYDPLYLTVVDNNNQIAGTQVKNGTMYNNLIINDVDPVTGKISITGSRLAKTTPTFSGQGTLAEITFLVKTTITNSTKTNINIFFDPAKTDNSNITESETNKNILTDVQSTTINIIP